MSKRKKTSKNRIKVIALLLTLISLCAVTIGTMAWLTEHREMKAVSKVRTPNIYYLKGPEGGTSDPLYVPRIDILAEDKSKELFYFSVIGKGNYKIQIGYTTNVPYQYAVYRILPVDTKEEAGSIAIDGAGNQLNRLQCIYEDRVNYYKYFETNATNLLTHKLNDNNGIAQNGTTLAGQKYASYESGDQVQINAKPIYEQTDLFSNEDDSADTGYYVLVIDWSDISTEDRLKYSEETDIICIVAGRY